MPADQQDINKMTAHLFRENSGKMAGVLTRIFGLGQIGTIMDVVQDTFESALTKWKYNGIPDNPSAWLMRVAKNKAINIFKREKKTVTLSSSAFVDRIDTLYEAEIEHLLMADEIDDSQLRLLLACCHPRFSEKNQVMLTLHILCGFDVTEIANALLMKSGAVKKALSRTKNELRQMGNIMQTPLLIKYQKRISIVQTILYLMFNEGYRTTRSREMINNDLCYEAIRLTKLLLKKRIALHSESNALLALMFFNLSRFPARLSSEGEIITLEEQDRKKWNRIFIEEGYYYLGEATKENILTAYHLEAIIASLHCAALDFKKTDWTTIVYLYQQLEKISPSPMIALNRIVAESYLYNAAVSLEQINELKCQASIQKHFLLYAAEADILKRTGKSEMAKAAFGIAYGYAHSPLDKLFLENKIAQC